MLKTKPDLMERSGRRGKQQGNWILLIRTETVSFISYFKFYYASLFLPCWLDLHVQFCITAIRYLMDDETDTRDIYSALPNAD